MTRAAARILTVADTAGNVEGRYRMEGTCMITKRWASLFVFIAMILLAGASVAQTDNQSHQPQLLLKHPFYFQESFLGDPLDTFVGFRCWDMKLSYRGFADTRCVPPHATRQSETDVVERVFYNFFNERLGSVQWITRSEKDHSRMLRTKLESAYSGGFNRAKGGYEEYQWHNEKIFVHYLLFPNGSINISVCDWAGIEEYFRKTKRSTDTLFIFQACTGLEASLHKE
ncbi:hypothetical protein A3J56_01085 [Candidatus Giovannonibacteria bacterium RIFCSPHIGHO2_02_FULL_46_20]|uniref:Uncharacterized protein n=1 Tax=Candidatus Giovannonibacteria bacterium RIFCSPHIGHO2_02_FULL_46_20 TaxID=1798338 RepID=A0A1F5WFW9_9BACT|nr:MAG: hypothetical protein A3J56_01085 [Candidatus Giovannonibacteria bacterium RIFCSPHIGHO2_02_FULL_46_20]